MMKFFAVHLLLLLRGAGSDLIASGQLSALDGAVKAASLGGSLLGVCTSDFVAVAAIGRSVVSNREMLAYPPERLWRVSGSSCVGAVGFGRDAGLVAEFARDECASHRFRFGSAPVVTRLADSMCDAVAAAARQGRPIGVHVVTAGVGARGPVLSHVDPTGRELRCTLIAVGHNSKRLKHELQSRLSDVTDPESARTIFRDIILQASSTEVPDQPLSRKHRDDAKDEWPPPPPTAFICITRDDYERSLLPSADYSWMAHPPVPLFSSSSSLESSSSSRS